MYYKSKFESPLGTIFLLSDGVFLKGLWFAEQKYFPYDILTGAVDKDDLDIFINTKNWLCRYFSKQNPSPSELKLAPEGSDFRHEVWNILMAVPYGEVTSYGEIAKIIAKRHGQKSMSAQAVGGAVGHNPISIVIPCHRVVGANGNLTGYAGGIDKKIYLLNLESQGKS